MTSKKISKYLLIGSMLGSLLIMVGHTYVYFKMHDAYKKKEYKNYYYYGSLAQILQPSVAEELIKTDIERSIASYSPKDEAFYPHSDLFSLYVKDHYNTKNLYSKGELVRLYEHYKNTPRGAPHQQNIMDGKAFVYAKEIKLAKRANFEGKQRYIASCNVSPLYSHIQILDTLLKSSIGHAIWSPIQGHREKITNKLEKDINKRLFVIQKQLKLYDNIDIAQKNGLFYTFLMKGLEKSIVNTKNKINKYKTYHMAKIEHTKNSNSDPVYKILNHTYSALKKEYINFAKENKDSLNRYKVQLNDNIVLYQDE